MHRHAPVIALALLACALAAPAAAQDAQLGYPAVPLLSTGTTILGQKIRYPAGDPHVDAAIVSLAPGQRAILHKHDVPLFAYILEGELTVDYGGYGKRVYRQGDSLVEAMDVAHFSVNTGTTPMRLLGVYIGAVGVKDMTPVPEPGAK
ncbi:quercetin dioxygenase-like cupin family protein [Rhodopseudomonas rhenobacensis]|uniref:Quercetin dioxygenase-like cupin family protein n=1 Tax=Rhodopseudomonas rhenobacensis TaxID=87461 RepID=A0A7W7Z5K3_9BRAD|nr:cupin domain-containing protein [Rhodopseudomonas rhenobacensis]MBB5048165.1 quercetin dioxygenase-like cupin family protein [Rhodopseudomonas rhenobacensis]